MNETTTKHINELPDSVEIGTPSKGGVIKIYFNADDPKRAEERIISAFAIKKLTQEKQNEQ